MKKILLIILLISIIAGVGIIIGVQKINKIENNGKLNIVVTCFPSYDFVKQIAGDNVNLTFLLGPGVEAHGYEPTASELIMIQEADCFIYIGGKMEQWTEKVIPTLNIDNTKLVCLADIVDTISQTEVEGAENNHNHEHDHAENAFDEHIWSSPANAIKMAEYLKNVIIELDYENAETYTKNAENYISEIKLVQSEMQEIVENRKRNRLVFGDRMPMQYFIEEFGLEVSAAFSGCTTETEASLQTMAYLVDLVKKEKIPVVLYIELGDGKIAKAICEQTGAEAMQIQTLHNISKEDFEKGETYVSLMKRNIEVLKKALY